MVILKSFIELLRGRRGRSGSANVLVESLSGSLITDLLTRSALRPTADANEKDLQVFTQKSTTPGGTQENDATIPSILHTLVMEPREFGCVKDGEKASSRSLRILGIDLARITASIELKAMGITSQETLDGLPVKSKLETNVTPSLFNTLRLRRVLQLRTSLKSLGLPTNGSVTTLFPKGGGKQ